jgi:hypothetical protein
MTARNITLPTRLARVCIGYLCLSPLIFGFDLMFRTLPSYPALEKVYNAAPLLKAG